MRVLKLVAALVFSFAIVLSVFAVTARADLADVTIEFAPDNAELAPGETEAIEVVAGELLSERVRVPTYRRSLL